VTGATVQLPTTDYHSNQEATTLLAIDVLIGVLGPALR